MTAKRDNPMGTPFVLLNSGQLVSGYLGLVALGITINHLF
jgi:hypothetical protein